MILYSSRFHWQFCSCESYAHRRARLSRQRSVVRPCGSLQTTGSGIPHPLLTRSTVRSRKATPVKNTENIEGAERKEDQNAAVMSYATLHDTNGRHLYDHVTDNVYDSPYSEHLSDNTVYGRRSDTDSAYEPEPTGPNAVVTINGVAVR